MKQQGRSKVRETEEQVITQLQKMKLQKTSGYRQWNKL